MIFASELFILDFKKMHHFVFKMHQICLINFYDNFNKKNQQNYPIYVKKKSMPWHKFETHTKVSDIIVIENIGYYKLYVTFSINYDNLSHSILSSQLIINSSTMGVNLTSILTL